MTDKPLIGSLGDLVAMAGMPSEPTLRKLIAERDDFPVLSRGTNGRAFEIDLRAAYAFVRQLQRDDEERARAHREAVNQLSLELLGEDALAASDGVALSAVERKQMLEAELAHIRLAQMRGDLVRADDIAAALSDVMVWFRDFGRGFAAKCGKRISFSREQLAVIEAVMRQGLAGLADRMEGLSGDVAASADASNAAAAAIPAGE